MPYVFISCEYDEGLHPSFTTIEHMDEKLIEYLDGKLMPEYKSAKKHWESPYSPGVVLTKLEKEGYEVISCCCNNDILHWTLRKVR